MNRQRRLEAIARRRALIDSQLHMLSASINNHEVRVPNIIRSRAGRQRAEQTQQQLNNFLPQQQMQIRQARQEPNRMAYNNSQQQFLVTQPNISTNDLSREYLGSANSSSTYGQDLVPVEISDKIAKIIASNNGDILKSFQTIRTDDGTLMVVLEGEGDGESSNVVRAEGYVNAVENEEFIQMQMQVSSATGGQTVVEDVSAPPVPAPPAQENLTVMDSGAGEAESYVVVQTENGDVLIPSSVYAQVLGQAQEVTPTTAQTEESIVNYIASESGAIENLMSSHNTSRSNCVSLPVPVKKFRPVSSASAPKVRTSAAGVQGRNTGGVLQTYSKAKGGKPPPPKKVIKKPSSGLGVAVRSETGVKLSTVKEEKPRPFRFELPELELEERMNDINDNFMSVPVPIKIDSVVSENAEVSQPTNVKYTMSKSSKNSELACGKCPATFTRVLDLLNHVKKDHVSAESQGSPSTEDPAGISTPPMTESVSIEIVQLQSITEPPDQTEVELPQPTSHEQTPVISQQVWTDPSGNQFALPDSVRAFTDENGTVYFQVISEEKQETLGTKEIKLEINEPVSEPAAFSLPNDSEELNFVHNYEIYLDEEGREIVSSAAPLNEAAAESQQGRRTLTKATAKVGNMSTFEDECIWVVQEEASEQDVGEVKFSSLGSFTPLDSEKSKPALMLSRSERGKAIEDNSTKQEELSISFRNIFQKVVKQDVAFN